MTKVPTFILGHRDFDNADGVFVAPGGDASTATPNQMSLYATAKIPQIAMIGIVSPPFPLVLPHTIGFAPIILPNLISADFITGTQGYIRPFDMAVQYPTNSQVKSEATQFTFLQSGAGRAINYFAYTIPAPT